MNDDLKPREDLIMMSKEQLVDIYFRLQEEYARLNKQHRQTLADNAAVSGALQKYRSDNLAIEQKHTALEKEHAELEEAYSQLQKKLSNPNPQ